MASTNGQAKTAPKNLTVELGRSGLRQFGGRIHEEFLHQLGGARGAATYREMRENDPVVNAVFHAIEMFIREVDWWAGGAEGPDAEEADEFAEGVRHDMSETWEDTISEVLSMLQYGWCFCETVYKWRMGENPDDGARDSVHDDGRLGWRKLPVVSQESLSRWEFDEEDGSLRGLWQRVNAANRGPGGGGFAGEAFIPIEKALLFRTQVRKRSPEGRSILRGAYRPWFFKKRIEEIEAIGVERDLAGYPVLKVEEGGPNLWDPNHARELQMAEGMIRGIRRDELEGAVVPPHFDLQLLSTGGQRQMDVGKIVERLDRRMAMVVLADAILVGHERVGSYNLMDVKRSMLAAGLEGWLDMIASVFNRYAYPRLFALNPFRLTKLPELQHSEVDQPDIEKLGEYVAKMVGANIIRVGPELEQFMRAAGKLPPVPEDRPEEGEPEEDEDDDDAGQPGEADDDAADAAEKEERE